MTFDLISDLYLTTMENFSWDNKPTSLYCIIAGNISADRTILFEFLSNISGYYNAVFFIDGDLEHNCYEGNIEESYKNLRAGIGFMENVMFLHENIVILNDITLIGTNGWTTFDFTNKSTVNHTIDFLSKSDMLTEEYCNNVFKMAISDQQYMYNSIETCQTMDECINLVLVTNAVPIPKFIEHNEDFNGTLLGDTTGNNGINGCLSKDVKGKVKSWIFGKFHEDIDYNIDGIRYVNNPGKGYDLDTYFPKRIEIS